MGQYFISVAFFKAHSILLSWFLKKHMAFSVCIQNSFPGTIQDAGLNLQRVGDIFQPEGWNNPAWFEGK